VSAVPRGLSRWRRFRRFVTYIAIRCTLFALRLPPLALARGIGAALGLFAYAAVGGERRRALEHLARAMPDLGPEERRRTVRRCFVHLGRSAAEIAQIDRIRRRFDRVVDFPEESRRVLEGALAKGKGVLVVAGHIGNWELMGFYLAWRGYPVRTLARGLADPRLSDFVRRYRESRGVFTILRGETAASRAILQAFRQGAILGFFLDQDTDVPGTFVPFFGRPAWTPIGAGVFAVRTGAEVVVATMVRADGGRHRLTVEPFHFEASDDRDADAVRITQGLTAELEAAIRRTPPQWVWMHRRWKRQPPPAP
jgi:KDO2-lipid IV(A) lauroyltransferase